MNITDTEQRSSRQPYTLALTLSLFVMISLATLSCLVGIETLEREFDTPKIQATILSMPESRQVDIKGTFGDYSANIVRRAGNDGEICYVLKRSNSTLVTTGCINSQAKSSGT